MAGQTPRWTVSMAGQGYRIYRDRVFQTWLATWDETATYLREQRNP